MTTRILQKAIDIVDADRQKQYGDPCENAESQAVIAAIILRRPVTALECNAINLAQKIVRMGRSDKEDTLIDVAGYAEIRARLLDKAKLVGEELECIYCTEPANKQQIYCDNHEENRAALSKKPIPLFDGELTPMRPKNVEL